MPVSHQIGAVIIAILCLLILIFCVVRFIHDQKEVKKLKDKEN
jgi:flagellar biogenesis protein FliO